MTTKMTAQEAITTSATSGETVHIEIHGMDIDDIRELAQELRLEAEDHVDHLLPSEPDEPVRYLSEYWGVDEDGATWRVHLQ